MWQELVPRDGEGGKGETIKIVLLRGSNHQCDGEGKVIRQGPSDSDVASLRIQLKVRVLGSICELN